MNSRTSRLVIASFILCGIAAAQQIDIHPVPCVRWQAEQGTTYAVQRSSALGGPWEAVGAVYATTSGPASWADLTGEIGAFYRISVETSPTGSVFEPFDGPEWPEPASTTWTSGVPSGLWIGKGCAVSHLPEIASSAPRCVAFSADWQRLTLPVGAGVTQITARYRGSQAMTEQAMLRLIAGQGGKWYQIGNPFSVSSAAWTSATWTISSPASWTSYAIETFWLLSPVYLDDVTISLRQ